MNEFKEYKRCCYRKAIVAGVTFILFENSESTEYVYLFFNMMCTCVSCMSAINLLYIYGQINQIIKTWQEKYQNTLVAGQIGQLDKVGSWFYESKQKEGNVVSIIQVEAVGNNIIETRRE
jgi:hypothetical protein